MFQNEISAKHLWNPWFSVKHYDFIKYSMKTTTVGYKKNSKVKNVLLKVKIISRWSKQLYKAVGFLFVFLVSFLKCSMKYFDELVTGRQ